MSLAIGATLGVLVCGLMGLNLFLAVLEDDTTSPAALQRVAAQESDNEDSGCSNNPAGCLDGTAGILLTGIVVGLGSNPTHEVIRALQRRKRSNTAETPATVGRSSSFSVTDNEAIAMSMSGFPGSSPALTRVASPTRTIRMTD